MSKSIRLLLVLGVALFLGGAVAAIGWQYQRAIRTSSALDWSGADLFIETHGAEFHPATLYLFGQFLGYGSKFEELSQLARQVQGSHWGAFRIGNQITFFVQDPTSELITEQTGWQQSIIESHGHRFLLLSDNEPVLPAGTSQTGLKQAFTKYHFAKLGQSQATTIAMREPGGWIIGGIAESAKMTSLRLSRSPLLLKRPLEFTQFPGGSLYITTAPVENSVLLPAPFADIPGLGFNRPSTLSLFTGNVQRLIQNPYDGQLSWRFRGELPLAEAQTYLNEHVRRLSETYPLLLDRSLPDGSSIGELQLNQEQFLLPGQSLDLTVQPTGTLTYPQGQLTYSYENGAISIQQGTEPQPSAAPTDFSCLIPQAKVAGYADASSLPALPVRQAGGRQAPEEYPWRRIEFSVSEQQLSLCLSTE